MPRSNALPSLPARQIDLHGRIIPEIVCRLEKTIVEFLKDSKEPILLSIDSHGGELRSSMRLARFLGLSETPVVGIVEGTAQSGAVYILAACRRRIAKKDATLRLHYNYTTVRVDINPFTDMERLGFEMGNKLLPRLESEWRKIEAIILPRLIASGKTAEDMHQAFREKKEFSATEALDWGLVDEVL